MNCKSSRFQFSFFFFNRLTHFLQSGYFVIVGLILKKDFTIKEGILIPGNKKGFR